MNQCCFCGEEIEKIYNYVCQEIAEFQEKRKLAEHDWMEGNYKQYQYHEANGALYALHGLKGHLKSKIKQLGKEFE